jgi:trehalose 6-phosphate synthase
MTDTVDANRNRLDELCSTELAGRQLILASNRGPLEYYFTPERELRTRRGAGGVVTALSGLSSCMPVVWIAAAMGEGDRALAARSGDRPVKIPGEGENLSLRFITCPRNMYHRYYNVFCNPLLWFLQHGMWDGARSPNVDRVIYSAWEKGYLPVNELFAGAIIDEVRRSQHPPLVFLNDYHLYTAAAVIRAALPKQVIQIFVHIPWPGPSSWQLLPTWMREPIIRSLCACDIVGFQTERDVQSFLSCCRAFIKDAEVDYNQGDVCVGGHVAQVRAYPVSIDVNSLDRTVNSSRLKEYLEKLRPLYGEQTIVRVDRVEPSKNIIRGFRAYDILLERHPELRGRVKFLAFLVPSRTNLKVYQRYEEDVRRLIEGINEKYGTADWHPIDFFYENNYVQAMAGMCDYDVLLVNAVIDGMNLVAKEGPTVNRRDGVLVLSEAAGAYEQLHEWALTVAPADLEGTAQALYTALTMSAGEKHTRAAGLRQQVVKEDVYAWVMRQIEDASNVSFD